MTDRLDEAKRLHAAATPGQWYAPDCEGSETVMDGEGDEVANCATKLCSSGQANADSIVAQHNLAPDLFALAEAAEKRVAHGHSNSCSAHLFDDLPCTCGHDALRAAVDRVRGRA